MLESGSRERMQGLDIASRERMQGRDINSRETMQGRDIGFRGGESQFERDHRERLTNLDINVRERLAATQAVDGAAGKYQNTLVNLNNNPNINADDREAQIQAARQEYERSMRLIEQLFNIDLDWNDPVEVTEDAA